VTLAVCGWGCSVKTTPHINHNLPDFVVSSYNEPGENSFSEVQSLDVMKNIQGGNLTTNSKSKRANSGLKFKEASVTGNPVAYAMGQAKYLCNSKIKPYMPYYLSTLDEKMWRSGLSDIYRKHGKSSLQLAKSFAICHFFSCNLHLCNPMIDKS
jgi:hypothetical protein